MTKNLVKSTPVLAQVYDRVLAKMGELNLPEAGWDACEELLRKSRGQA
jgi:hypothetical protein